MALVTCSECQAQVSDKAVSCPHCGNVFRRCPECGAEVRSGATTCANCGYPLMLATKGPATSATGLLADNTQVFGGIQPVIYAGFWRRFAAAIIDGLLVGLLVGGLDIVAGLAIGFRGTAFSAISTAVSLGIGVAYYVGLE